jgi:hypothetical protein
MFEYRDKFICYCFGGGGGQTVYAPPAPPPPKVPPRTDPATNVGQFQEEPVNAYGEPLGVTETVREVQGNAGQAVSQTKATYLPYYSQNKPRFRF